MIGADGAAGDRRATGVSVRAGQQEAALRGSDRPGAADDLGEDRQAGPVERQSAFVGDCTESDGTRRGSVADTERTGADRRGSGISVRSGEIQDAGAELGDRARAGDRAREESIVRTIEDQGAVVDQVTDNRTRRTARADAQRAGRERGAARIGIGAGEDLRAGAEFGQSTGRADRGVRDDSGERSRPGGAVGAGGVIIDAEGKRTETAGEADRDIARAGKGIDPHRAFDAGQAGAAGNVQVGEVIGPDFVAVAAAGEDAALDVDECARPEGEGRDRGAPERAAIAGLQERAGAAESRRNVIAATRSDIEGQRGAGEHRVHRRSVDVLIGKAAGDDGGFPGIRGGGRERGVTRAELEDPARAGDRSG